MLYFLGAKRRGNRYYFVASKDDCGWWLLQQRGNSSSSAELAAGSFTFGLTSREETCCPPTTTLHSFLTAGQLLKRFSSKTNFYKVLSQTLKSLWGQGQARGVSEPRLGLLMEPALFRGGSVHRTIHNTNLWKFGVFSLKMHQFVRENLGSRR